ncbi:hypothetical protein IJS98_00205 [bacterium]|nr:hypothetical protein [bacterium]
MNKEYEKHLEELKSEKMPKDWVELYREEIPGKLDYFERTIKNYLEWQAKGSYVERELKKARSDLAFYQSIRHRTDDLEDPASDPDQDGLDNRTEYARGTHPLLKDYVSAYPKYYEVVYDHSPVVTGTFYLVNTFNKSVTVDWDNLLSRFSDFYKLNISINGQPAPEIINLPPASTNRLDCFFNAEAFPRFFDEAYKIDFFDITNEFDNAQFSVRFHTYEDNSRPLISPKIVKPENGSLYSCNDEIAFSWEEPEGKAMKKDRNERMHYKLQFIDPFGVKGERDVSKSGNAFVKRHQNFKANELEPGTYFWRANKQDRFHAPVSSDWGWLAIGREIAPEKPKGKGSDQACVQGHNGAEVVFATVGKKYDLPIQMRSNLNSHFLKSLLENQEVFFQSNGAYNPNCFHIKGVFEKAGVHTNIWLNINSKGETNEVTFIFLVHNPSEEKNVRSFYHLPDKTIVHELFVNVPFEYKERKFFEAFSKKDDLIWDENLKMEFSEALPEGLSVNLIEKGEDLEVKGIPLTAGIFKIDLVFSNGTRQLEERHVFKIKDIGEPPFEFEKKIYIPRKKEKTY